MHRLANSLRSCDVRRRVYVSDQEGALEAHTEAAVTELNIDGNSANAIPEHSPHGEIDIEWLGRKGGATGRRIGNDNESRC